MSLPFAATGQDAALLVRWQAPGGLVDPPWLRLGQGRWTIGSDWSCEILAPGCAEPRLAALVLDAGGAGIEALCGDVTVNDEPLPPGVRWGFAAQATLQGGGVVLLVRAEASGPQGGIVVATGQGAFAAPAAWLVGRLAGMRGWPAIAGMAGVSALLAIAAGSGVRPAGPGLPPPAPATPLPPAHARTLSDPDSVSDELTAGLTRIGSPFRATARDGSVVVDGQGSARDLTLARVLVDGVQKATPVPIALSGSDPAEIRLPVAFVIAGRVALLRSGERLRAGDRLEKGWRVEQIGSDGIRLRRDGVERFVAAEAEAGWPGSAPAPASFNPSMEGLEHSRRR